MFRPLTTRPLLPFLLRGSSTIPTRTLTTTSRRHRDSIIPPALKHTAKAIDHAAATAAIKGIEAGETIASAARSAISTSSPKSPSPSDQPIGSDMYGEQDLRPDSTTSEAGRGATTATGATAKRAAQEAKGDINEVVGRAEEAKEEAKGQAKKMAGEAKGRMSKSL